MPPWGRTAVVHVGKEETKARCPWCSISCWFADLGEHGFAVLGHHAALVTVEGYKVAVECLLGVLKYIVQLRSTPLKNAAEVAWDQGPANGCTDRTNCSRQRYFKKDQGRLSKFSQRPLTVSLWSILQAESDGQHGIILKELSRESIPPEIVTLLKSTEMSVRVQRDIQKGSSSGPPLLVSIPLAIPLSSSVAAC